MCKEERGRTVWSGSDPNVWGGRGDTGWSSPNPDVWVRGRAKQPSDGLEKQGRGRAVMIRMDDLVGGGEGIRENGVAPIQMCGGEVALIQECAW